MTGQYYVDSRFVKKNKKYIFKGRDGRIYECGLPIADFDMNTREDIEFFLEHVDCTSIHHVNVEEDVLDNQPHLEEDQEHYQIMMPLVTSEFELPPPPTDLSDDMAYRKWTLENH
ncbi:hypothetical protein AALP_AAs46761U000100 [Arabis alpina]|uniref:Uncharacterized protein n=1 Tax=Arabis alpina TaxID=50452 RepID=A0A087G1R1_ARAAL|nr:hypothetical protein AALP_AAs46761U000100 [Arabis alpina]